MNESIKQKSIVDMAELAEQLEEDAKTMTDVGSYEHVFKEPWENGVKVYDSLHFDWTKLTGGDSLAIEAELRLRGITLIAPAFTGDFLAGMAARACLERMDEDGTIVIRTVDIKDLPMPDFLAITSQARNYLLHEGF